jgi:hypothetical protein
MTVRQIRTFDPPVQPSENETQTIGCRHGNKLNCGRNSTPKVCALVRDDGRCLAPPSSWVRFYRGLVAMREEEERVGWT